METTLLKLTKENLFSETGLLSRIEKLEKQLEALQSTAGKFLPKPGPGSRPENNLKVPERTPVKPAPSEAIPTRSDNRDLAERPKSQVKEDKAEVTNKKGDLREGDFQRVKNAWPMILNQIKKEKISTYTHLLGSQLSKVEKDTIIIEFTDRAVFHREQMEKAQNRRLLQSALRSVLGWEARISFRSKAQEEAPTKEETPVSAVAGGKIDQRKVEMTEPEVTELVKNIFGAEIVEEARLEEGRS